MSNSTGHLELGILRVVLTVASLSGECLPQFNPCVVHMHPHASVWPLVLGTWTPTLWGGPLSRGYRLPRFSPAPQLGDAKSHALMWSLELGIWIPMFWCGPLWC